MKREWRVAWRRADGGVLRSKRVRNVAHGERLVRFLRGEFADPDAWACCDGHECGCGGLTQREAWEAYREAHTQWDGDPETSPRPLADITWGPVVQVRTVTTWEGVSRG